jgi:hypothetical protein
MNPDPGHVRRLSYFLSRDGRTFSVSTARNPNGKNKLTQGLATPGHVCKLCIFCKKLHKNEEVNYTS